MWKRWIRKQGVKNIAKQLNITDQAVYKWLWDKGLPSDKNKKKLIKISRGAIGPADFFEIENHG